MKGEPDARRLAHLVGAPEEVRKEAFTDDWKHSRTAAGLLAQSFGNTRGQSGLS